MKEVLTLVIIFFNLNAANSQFIIEKSINAQIGYAVSSPYYSADNIVNSGLFLQAELVLKATSWFELRPYAGLIITNSNGKDLDDNPTLEISETKAFIIGGKARLRAPIPYIAPYLELGLGASIGEFITLTTFTNIEKSGFIYHIPISFGLELGKYHNVELGFSYYAQPTVEQSAGAFALGIKIPL